MAIQNRRGNYGDFDKSKMLAGEFAIVLQDDPDTSDGKAAYIAFSPGSAKRLMTKEDLDEGIEEATQQVVDAIVASVEGLVGEAETAVTNAQDAAEDASESASQAASVIPELNQDNATAGSAHQLLSKNYTEVKVPYHFKATKPDASADIGDREYLDIVGGSVGWNQLAPELSGTCWDKRTNDASVSFADGVASYTTAVKFAGMQEKSAYAPTIVEDHKYLIKFNTKSTAVCQTQIAVSSTGINFVFTNTAADTWYEASAILNATGSASTIFFIRNASNLTTSVTTDIAKLIIIDLTLLFGSTIADYIYSLEHANAGVGVAWFKKFFPKDYYAYDAGSLKSVEGLESHETVGFNQWDGTLVTGYIDDSDGALKDTTNEKNKATDFIKVIPNQTYYIRTINTYGTWGAWYDSNKNYISGISGYNATKTAPSNAEYMRCTVRYNASESLEGFCINLSWSGYRNGEYEPYIKHSYPLDSSLTLRGIPKKDADGNLYFDGDVYSADGTVHRRYGVVDLGTLTWTKQTHATAGDYFRAGSTGLNIKKTASQNDKANAICSKYEIEASADVPNGTIAVGASGDNPWIYVRDFTYTDASDFSSAMNGVMFVYELATPTTETADSFQNPQIVDDFGTEEFVTDSIVPVGHNTKYPANLRERIESIPVLPTTAGNYRLSVTIVNNKPVYEWVTT